MRLSHAVAAGLFSLVLTIAVSGVAAPEPETPATVVEPVPVVAPAAAVEENPASNDTVQAFLQLQHQIYEAQLAIEQARIDAEASVAKNAEGFAARLQEINDSADARRMRELESIQSTTRFMLVALFAFAVLGFCAVAVTAWFLWRAISRLSLVPAAAPAGHGMESLRHFQALGPGEADLPAALPLDTTNGRLSGMIERLQRRIRELEQTAHAGGETVSANGGSSGGSHRHASPEIAVRAAALLEKGQSLLSGNEAEGALACFDEVLALEPDNAEALVKKGAALEKLRRLEEAVEYYDRAIAADGSMTIAYLHKGGVYNRMERFGEAVECYEQALRTQEKKRAS